MKNKIDKLFDKRFDVILEDNLEYWNVPNNVDPWAVKDFIHNEVIPVVLEELEPESHKGQNSLDYILGWSDCRQKFLKKKKEIKKRLTP